jgi:ribosomal-protein-alanine N-acetyltransferase
MDLPLEISGHKKRQAKTFMPKQPTITTKRLILVPLTAGDAAALFPIAKNPASIEDFQVVAKTVDDVAKWVNASIESNTASWTIRLNKRVIGFVEIDIYSNQAIAETGYFIAETEQGNGFATEAVVAAVDWAFGQTNVHRIEAGISDWNTGSARVVEKAGFLFEGKSRLNWHYGGRWYDSLNYAILKTDWQKRRNNEQNTAHKRKLV